MIGKKDSIHLCVLLSNIKLSNEAPHISLFLSPMALIVFSLLNFILRKFKMNNFQKSSSSPIDRLRKKFNSTNNKTLQWQDDEKAVRNGIRSFNVKVENLYLSNSFI